MAVRFTTVLEDAPGPIGIVVPEDSMAQLGPAKRYPVVVTVNGYSYRNSVSWYKGAFRIALSADNQKAAGVGKGDSVDVSLELDDAPRILDIPDEFAEGLASAGVAEKFAELSYSRQRTFVDPWVAAKSQETRDKNLSKAIAALAG